MMRPPTAPQRNTEKASASDLKTCPTEPIAARVHTRPSPSAPSLADNLLTAIQIKRNLIEKAKLKKEYAKQLQQAGDDILPKRPATYATTEDDAPDAPDSPKEDAQLEVAPEPLKAPRNPKSKPKPKSPSPGPTPAPAPVEEASTEEAESNLSGIHHSRRQKIIPFAKEHRFAQRQKREAEERREAYETSQRERAEKTEERERFRKAMAKARSGGKNGQRKLGRESTVLLDRIKRMVQQ
jgi:hypothetical protein